MEKQIHHHCSVSSVGTSISERQSGFLNANSSFKQVISLFVLNFFNCHFCGKRDNSPQHEQITHQSFCEQFHVGTICFLQNKPVTSAVSARSEALPSSVI